MPTQQPAPFDFSRTQIADRLKVISIELIAAHRKGNTVLLDRFAIQAGLWDGESTERPNRLFMKLIQIFHPDRLDLIMQEIAECQARSDLNRLKTIETRLNLNPSQTQIDGFEGQSFSWSIHPGDFGFGEAEWGDHEDGADLYYERKGSKRSSINITEAMRREHFGNLDLNLTREDLEEMDGELELPDMDIESLSGLQFCRHLTGLNLAANCIHDINPLRFLRNLEWLDLSGNQIEDADCLERLGRIRELDLSDNDIDDVRFLEGMTGLRLVNLSGNPVRDAACVRERLAARGVLIIG